MVKEEAIEELKLRDFMVKEETPEAKLDALARWALSYKEAYDLQKPMLDEIHECASKYHLALGKVQKDADILKSDIGKALRLLGVACQQIKAVREAKYTEALDGSFKRYLESKTRTIAPEDREKMRERADSLVVPEILEHAKDYEKQKRAMEAVANKGNKRAFKKRKRPEEKEDPEEPNKKKQKQKANKSDKSKNVAAKKRRKKDKAKNKAKDKGKDKDKKKPKADDE